jgi:hypothetical protein
MLELETKRPEDVFTPRQSKVNPSMYVERPELEADLRDALTSTQHVFVHGESGTGKSWLYKKVLFDLGATMVAGNLANAARLGSIENEFKNILERGGDATVTSFREKKSASADALVAKAGVEHEKTFIVGQKEPFEACCALARSRAGKQPAFIVLDNLEAVFDNTKVMDELAQLVILLDDERYSQYAVKLLIVGVPTGVRDYFNHTPNRSTVANRLYEIAEVSNLTKDQARDLVDRGLVKELGLKATPEDMTTVVAHVLWVTSRVPQRLHEYCLELARIGRKEHGVLLPSMLLDADQKWLKSSLSHSYGVVEALMNERDTKVGRRNQTIYVIGQMSESEFGLSLVEEAIRANFPKTTEGISLDCSTLLAHLASGESPVLRRTPKGDSYQFTDPKYRMCIRAMLRKDPDAGTVSKIPISAAASGKDDL